MKKILSIDGGGIRGIIPARVLVEIEKKTGKPIAQLFDMIVGTSTGGLLALGLNVPTLSPNPTPKYSAEDILQIYTDKGASIFDKGNPIRRFNPYGFFDELYDATKFEALLDSYFFQNMLGDCIANTMVTSYDIHSRTPYVFKSWQARTGGQPDIPMCQVARATSAAPTYFEPVRIKTSNIDGILALVDGGLYANNPTMCALAEYLKITQDRSEELMIVSLGTGELNRKFEYNQAKDWGKLNWINPIISIMFQGVSATVHYQVKHMMSAFDMGHNYYRLQTMLDLGNDDMDDVSEENIDSLKNEAVQILTDCDRVIDEICQKLVAN